MDRLTNTLVDTIRTDNKDSKQDTSKLFFYIFSKVCKFWAETRAGI